MRNTIKQNQIKKVYEVTLGYYLLKKKNYYEDASGDTINVVALDVWDALDMAGDWILDKERKAKRKGEGVFVSEVTMRAKIDLI